MNRTVYVAIGLAALVPFGLRAVTWPSARVLTTDAGMVQAGETLFKHDWKPKDPLTPGGDGLGPVFNATSCVACHKQGGIGGAGGLSANVTTFVLETPGGRPRTGVVHAFAVHPRHQETLAQVDPQLPATSRPTLDQLVRLPNRDNHCIDFPSNAHISQRNTPALFGAKLIDEIPDRVIIAQERSQRLRWGLMPTGSEDVPVGRALRLADGRVGHFGWKAQSASLSDFVQAACANELGLSNPGQPQPQPLGSPGYRSTGTDLTQEQCDQMTAFIASLPRPVERMPADPAACEQARVGKKLFHRVGCADCHTPDLGSVEGIYSDLLLHRMGREMVGGGSYGDPPPEVPDFKPGEGPQSDEWRTPPLWGVADSAPYLHDGRAATLEEAIQLHGGQGARSAQKFARLSPAEQACLVAFLKTLRAP